jgi:hypothetical protein
MGKCQGWVEVILKPHVTDDVPPWIVPIILLDSFSVCQKGSVVNAIQALGVEDKFIPPRYTGLVPPIDVGFNKPFKSKLKAQFCKLDDAPRSQYAYTPLDPLRCHWMDH